MAYVNNSDVLTLISGFELTGFTDDAQSGQINQGVLDTIMQMASDAADAFVASIYSTPFTSYVPKKIKDAALIFTCEALYARRLSPDEKNPFKTRADLYRQQLTTIGSGTVPLDANVARAFQPGVAITLNSRVTPGINQNPALDEQIWT